VSDTWQLADAVNLRPETFGGMAFHREHGVTLELDAEAYRFLCRYLTPCSLPPPDHPAARLTPQLVRLGFLCPAETDREQTQPAIEVPWSGNGLTLSAPETLHLAITARCNLFCPGCYSLQPGIGPELTTTELCGLIDQWAQMRIFQLAVGGGEPLLCQEKLFDVLTYARQRGIVPNLTTNGTLLTADVIRRLEEVGVSRINISWNGPGSAHLQRSQTVAQAIHLLLDSTLQVGVNLLVTPPLLPRLSDILIRLQRIGVRNVTFLRPKPPAALTKASTAWYKANRLHRSDLLQLRSIMNTWQGALKLEVGSALVSLMGDVPLAFLRQRAVYGCAAGRRICTVWPDGRVTPCSFLADLSAGNVRQTPFAELWQRGENWHALRNPTTRPQGGCIGCAIASQCGGACCVSRYEHSNLFAGDAECLHYQMDAHCAS
jgi:radical SAM protein with 4Fe4S-binding SPASM domain